MESTCSGGRNSQVNGQRRTWNVDEESALIQGLRDLVSRGWKCDNGFRSGYTNILEQHMARCFPGTTIRAEPHISSKITVWKKTYGEGAQGFTDAVNGVLHEPSVHAPSPIPTQDSFPEPLEHPDTNMDSFSAQAGESSASGKSKRHGKRKRNPEVEDKIIGLISSVCEETNKRLSELSSRFTNQGDAKEQRIAEEEEVCYRLFFQKCAETDDVHMAHLSELMQKDFSWMKVRDKIHCLEGHYREFLRYMTTPGCEPRLLEFRRRVDLETNPGQSVQNPILMDVMEDDVEVEEQVPLPIEEDEVFMGPNEMDDEQELGENESDVDSCVDSN
ncbi:peptidyl-prolyl cis-trans isomerases [Striga asiatica]|uniref:Peptidyl-prolyl cis-trans isomerases n=1 Tax=Striga asiatica TaxID=4170 RepID=A0A5A7PG31_STRAF|nr:peptidyl-prolyl cis-trans isomerases [Striga asiatica]